MPSHDQRVSQQSVSECPYSQYIHTYRHIHVPCRRSRLKWHHPRGTGGLTCIPIVPSSHHTRTHPHGEAEPTERNDGTDCMETQRSLDKQDQTRPDQTRHDFFFSLRVRCDMRCVGPSVTDRLKKSGWGKWGREGKKRRAGRDLLPVRYWCSCVHVQHSMYYWDLLFQHHVFSSLSHTKGKKKKKETNFSADSENGRRKHCKPFLP